MRGEVCVLPVVLEAGQPDVALVVEHEVGHRVGDQHVRADVELALIQQQRIVDVPGKQTSHTRIIVREREMFYLTTHSTHFIYGYMASDIWLRTILRGRKETCCRHIGYFVTPVVEHWLEREIAQWRIIIMTELFIYVLKIKSMSKSHNNKIPNVSLRNCQHLQEKLFI